jgi:hypothetical protein
MLELPAGRYELSGRARSTEGASTTRVLARLVCRPGSGAFTAARRAGGDRFALILAVPTGCPTPTLELAIEPGAGTIALDDLAIARLG